MEDVLTSHADRVRTANEKHVLRAEEAHKYATAALDAALGAFADAIVEAVRGLTEAEQSVMATMKKIAANAQADLEDAFTSNVMAISASETAMRAAMQARQTFFATGKLPELPTLPDIANGPSMAAPANDETPDARPAA